MGIQPTTSGLDLPLLCRLSYEAGQRKSGTIRVVNRGEEKVRVHMNVVPRSTMNTKGLRRRANARNVSFRISLWWLIYIVNSVDKTKLSCQCLTLKVTYRNGISIDKLCDRQTYCSVVDTELIQWINLWKLFRYYYYVVLACTDSYVCLIVFAVFM